MSGHSVCWWNENNEYVYCQSQGWIPSGSGGKWAACSSNARAIEFKFLIWCSIVQSVCMRAFRLLACLRRPASNPGTRFNIKMTSYQYRKSHCGDKTILRPSYLHNGISYTGKMTSLYWIGALVSSEEDLLSIFDSKSLPCDRVSKLNQVKTTNMYVCMWVCRYVDVCICK